MWLKIRIWTKLAVVILVVIWLTLFIVGNISQRATIWFFWGAEIETPVLLLVVFALLLGALSMVVIRTIRGTIEQISLLRQRQAAEQQQRDLQSLKEKAGMLNKDRPAS